MYKYFSFLVTLIITIGYLTPSANAQYYFKDILNTKKLNQEFSELKKAKVKFIKLNSFEDNDAPSEGFLAEKKFNKDYSQSEMISRSYITEETLIKTDYDNEGRIIKTTTTTPTITNTTGYTYDNSGNLIEVSTSTFDDGDSSKMSELHKYTYQGGIPEKMTVSRNKSILFTINFVKDEHGNIIEENDGGKADEKKYYYYYDTRNRLTDIVRYNRTAGRLLPDYMFEYDAGLLPIKMTTIAEGGRNYFIWRYAYTANHLPEIEKCYSKEKRLLGTIQYEYK
jgi:YD repeat-containing protein